MDLILKNFVDFIVMIVIDGIYVIKFKRMRNDDDVTMQDLTVVIDDPKVGLLLGTENRKRTESKRRITDGC